MIRYRYLFADLVLGSQVALEGLPLTEGGPDFVYGGRSRSRPTTAGAVARHENAGLEWLRIYDSGVGLVFEFPRQVWFGVSSDGFIESFPEPGVAESTVRHLLLAQVMPLLAASSGAAVLHASAVTVPPHGQAVLFVGPSGSGKSSTAVACSLAGADLLCDDFAVLRPQGAGYQVVPANHGVRLWPDVVSRLGRAHDAVAGHTRKRRLPVPSRQGGARSPVGVGILALLGDRLAADSAQVSVSTPADAVIELIDQSFRLKPADIEGHVSSLEVASTLVDSVPVLRVRLPDDLERMDRLGEELLETFRKLLGGHSLREAQQKT